MRMSAYDQDQRLSQVAARSDFLHAVSDVAPEVLETLADRPYKAVCDLWSTRAESRVAEEFFDHDRWEDVRLTTDSLRPLLLPLKVSIVEWGERFDLTEHWIYDVALSTLKMWAEDSSEYEGRRWRLGGAGGGSAFSKGERRFTFDYDPLFEEYGAAKVRLQAEFRQFADGLHEKSVERGLNRTRDITSVEHLTWLVEYQVKGCSMYRVRKELAADRSQQAVSSGIRSAAERVGLRLRPPARGPSPTKR